MSNGRRQITVAISGHWLLGYIPLSGSRLQEHLNDSGTDFLTLFDVEAHPLSNREDITRLPEITVPKAKAQIITVPTSQHEAPEKRWNNRTAKEAYSAFVIASNYRISGNLHFPTKPSGSPFVLMAQLGKFFAVTDASFGHGRKQLNVPLLLVNKEFVNCLYVGEQAALESAVVNAELAASARG